MVHPRAKVLSMRNMPRGIEARSKILRFLEDSGPTTTPELKERLGMSSSKLYYHLGVLQEAETVSRRGKRPIVWSVTERGQSRLAEEG